MSDITAYVNSSSSVFTISIVGSAAQPAAASVVDITVAAAQQLPVSSNLISLPMIMENGSPVSHYAHVAAASAGLATVKFKLRLKIDLSAASRQPDIQCAVKNACDNQLQSMLNGEVVSRAV